MITNITIVATVYILVLLLIARMANVNYKYKLLLFASTIFVTVGTYTYVKANMGFPIEEGKPRNAVCLVGIDIREPSQKTLGSIYLWTTDSEEEQKTKQIPPPKAIKLSYNKAMAREFYDLKVKIANGDQICVVFKKSQSQNLNGFADEENAQGEIDFVPPPSQENKKV